MNAALSSFTVRQLLRMALELKDRLDCLGMSPGTEAAHQVEAEFLHGIWAAANAVGYPMPHAFLRTWTTGGSILNLTYREIDRLETEAAYTPNPFCKERGGDAARTSP